MTTRTCRKCGTEKPISCFPKAKSNRYGIAWRCSSCAVKNSRIWAENNKERHKKRQTEYFKRNKEKIYARIREANRRNPEKRKAIQDRYKKTHPDYTRTKHFRRRYGFGLLDYRKILSEQGGLCCICNKPEMGILKGRLKLLAVDHCHKTGFVRGLLCQNCNRALGCIQDDIAILDSMRKYLTKDYSKNHRIPLPYSDVR